MGWIPYSKTRGIGLGARFFESDPLVRFFILNEDKKMCYLIKELSREEKQKSKKLYKFILLNYKDIEKPIFESKQFSSNYEMFLLVIEYEACNEIYQRHFKINKVLKNE